MGWDGLLFCHSESSPCLISLCRQAFGRGTLSGWWPTNPATKISMPRRLTFSQGHYFFSSLLAWLAGRQSKCPNCDARSREVVDRKWIVTTLRRCPKCCLLYRAPTTPAKQQSEFYQRQYSQGFTTDLPSKEKLRDLMEGGFVGTERDYSRYLKLLFGLGIKKGSRILEYGCSWGYGAWQLKQAGFRVTAFEISQPRCRYAREKLAVEAVEELSGAEGGFDASFSSHVLEHVDNVETALERQMGLLRPGGWLVGVTPNGSLSYRKEHAANFHRLWGLVHPQLLTNEFLHKKFAGMELRLGSVSGVEGIDEVTRPGNLHPALHRWELAFAVHKPASAVD